MHCDFLIDLNETISVTRLGDLSLFGQLFQHVVTISMVHFSLQFFGDFTHTSGHPSNCKKINYWAQWLESYIQGRQVLKQFCNALANKTIKIVLH